MNTRKEFAEVGKWVKWKPIATEYFNRTPGWMAQKMSANGQAEFTEEERQTLKTALLDVAAKILQFATTL